MREESGPRYRPSLRTAMRSPLKNNKLLFFERDSLLQSTPFSSLFGLYCNAFSTFPCLDPYSSFMDEEHSPSIQKSYAFASRMEYALPSCTPQYTPPPSSLTFPFPLFSCRSSPSGPILYMDDSFTFSYLLRFFGGAGVCHLEVFVLSPSLVNF